MHVHKTEKQMKEVDVTIDSYDLCDKCNQKIETRGSSAFDFKLTFQTGSSYPEGGSGNTRSVDLCENCAHDLMRMLEREGYRVNFSEWDW